MPNFRFLAVLLALAVCGGVARAQQAGDDSQQQQDAQQSLQQSDAKVGCWKVILPGGVYTVALDRISSVSLQRYVLDGAARVTELNIATPGVMQPRFYYIEMLASAGPTASSQALIESKQNQASALAKKASPEDPLATKVVKSYPTTTHAGTIEYRVETRQEIEWLYESVERAWLARKPEILTLDGARAVGVTSATGGEEGQSEQNNTTSDQ